MRDELIAMEDARVIKDEIAVILEENWRAVGHAYPDSKLRPDIDLYLTLAGHGVLKLFTVRVAKQIVGYAAVLLSRHPHRMDDLVATIDSIFVLPDFRGGGVAARLLQRIENDLRALGVSLLAIGARDDRFERWLRLAHYARVETVWERRL